MCVLTRQSSSKIQILKCFRPGRQSSHFDGPCWLFDCRLRKRTTAIGKTFATISISFLISISSMRMWYFSGWSQRFAFLRFYFHLHFISAKMSHLIRCYCIAENLCVFSVYSIKGPKSIQQHHLPVSEAWELFIHVNPSFVDAFCQSHLSPASNLHCSPVDRNLKFLIAHKYQAANVPFLGFWFSSKNIFILKFCFI